MLPEYRIIETAKLAMADVKETFPELCHDLNPIAIGIDRAVKRKGATHFKRNRTTGKYEPRRITLSKYHTDPVKVDNTTRHEIAHVLAGYDAKHGPEWQRWAVRLGVEPVACGQERALHVPIKRGHTIECPTGCGSKRTFHRNCATLDAARRGERFQCNRCNYKGLFKVV